MDQGRVLQLMMQYLKENMLTETLYSLQDETGFKLVPGAKGSELQTILDDHEEQQTMMLAAGDGDEDPLAGVPDEPVVTKEAAHFAEMHPANVVALKFNPHDGNMLASGGANAKILLSDLEGNVSKELETPGRGALLSLDFHPKDPSLLLSSFMDGSHTISNIHDGSVVQHFQHHKKFNTKVQWSPCGNLFATCSHDHTVKIYRQAEQDGWQVASTHEFSSVAESMCFGPGALVVAVREDYRVHYIDLETGEVGTQSLNNLEGDTHVWCSVLDLSLIHISEPTRLLSISYAVFCLKKKKKKKRK
eukprot:TRINITY_DN19756_c0_g3_i23.p1 TRINITY_DN19756_c0_g3~~TRINITY_DN19756_c0_g3_i23.p1  ORF type:complete len:304 (-),score=113.84 TRINITY_DN19756_c0_g3_i23:59-970(-)